MNIKITDVRSIGGDSAFLIDDGKTAVLYDTGFAFTGYAVADNIKSQLKDRALDYIFLTHSHYDHAAGTPYILRRYPKAKVVAGEYAVKIFSKPSAKNLMRDLDRKFAHKCGVDEYEDLFDELLVDIPVKDGDKIKAGDMCFTAVYLPGHTRCSVGYYLESEKLLLSCETLGVFDGDKSILPSYLVGVKLTLDSIKRAETLDIEKILIPHLGVLSKEQTEFYLNNAYKSALDTACEIAEILRSGKGKEYAVNYFTDKFYHGEVKAVYPVDAMLLNTGITVDLIERELLDRDKA